MKRMKPLALAAVGVLGLAALAGGATLATAASSASTAITARQANFKKMGGAMKTLKDELSGGADKAKMIAAAKTIAAAGRKQGDLFPAGTGPSSGAKTDALAAIWSDRATFDAGMKKMIAEADKLAAVAGSGDASAIRAQFTATGKSCGACHRQFRADN
ncbi:c-type cytochrome [Novosphingobium mangrovi (ex Huang et al. 2023)]|uniref:Cytochrome c n=1 Tax=Novosphingobium mangrovi (ex Huang et al. 2023) TaxID=2976432 RepID=A0ABT2I2C6_9SPHN|nr:cytochrome c [Novosphingobium mangrovi (ex Huang et al. 2023)]MCT2398960.1 cytochrome c [Novosphingobium mangrovi (ex Huang et al. 2023)]